ncbi:MAG: hypothetical protein IPH36_09210 [Saprospiraceae bacterium]|nr:hypothetical protein [Saprospiraceae bacterium]
MEQDWVNQKTGVINHYNPKQDLGDQPVRTLHKILKWMFYTSSEEISKEIYDLIVGGGIQVEIEIEVGNEAIFQPGKSLTPFVDSTKQLKIHETFLSYVWCISYSLYILYNEEVSYPTINKNVGYEKYKQSPDEIRKAYEVLSYGISIINKFVEWDKDKLPNPGNLYG